MDTQNNIVYSMNAQYAGNSVGLKKHSMRLANKAGQEGWLCEHMFLMACVNDDANRKTYFAGALKNRSYHISFVKFVLEKFLIKIDKNH